LEKERKGKDRSCEFKLFDIAGGGPSFDSKDWALLRGPTKSGWQAEKKGESALSAQTETGADPQEKGNLLTAGKGLQASCLTNGPLENRGLVKKVQRKRVTKTKKVETRGPGRHS